MKKLLLTTALVLGFIGSANALDYDCPNRVITVINRSSHIITDIRLSGRDSTIWSGNYLSDFDLYPGEQVTIDGDYAPGSGSGYHMFDAYARAIDGVEWNEYINLCTTVTWTLYD